MKYIHMSEVTVNLILVTSSVGCDCTRLELKMDWWAVGTSQSSRNFGWVHFNSQQQETLEGKESPRT